MLKIVSILSIIASAFAGGLEPHVATLGAPTLLSSRLVAPSLLSKVVAPTVLSGLATQHVTVARPAHLAVERVSIGSVPSLSVVNEPTTIVTPGKPIRGHSFTSEVRHDAVGHYAAPVVAYSPLTAKIVETPAVSEVVESPELSHYTSNVFLSSPLKTVVSAPQVYATGAAQVVAGPASVKGYTRETGRTELVNELRLREASIPATIVEDRVVESVPALHLSQPLVTKSVWGAPLISTLIKK